VTGRIGSAVLEPSTIAVIVASMLSIFGFGLMRKRRRA
jgi:hypothetical protein